MTRVRVAGVRLLRRTARVVHRDAKRSWTEREGIVLALETDAGTGLGEASPLPGYSCDALSTCEGELREASSRLDALEVEGAIEALLEDAVARARVTSPAAVFAVETAALDVIARARREPAWRTLRGDDRARPVPLSGLADGPDPVSLADAAEACAARGLRVVKLKIGGPEAETRDPARLGAVRARLGAGFGLRLDANQTLSAERLPDVLDALAAYDPELVEEPSTPDAVDRLARSPVPLAMDESLMRSDWEARLRAGAARGICSAVVLKPMSIGGLLRARAIARVADELGLGALVTHLFDGPVATAATACLALSFGGRVLPCGLDTHGRLGDTMPGVTPTAIEPVDVLGLGLSPPPPEGA